MIDVVTLHSGFRGSRSDALFLDISRHFRMQTNTLINKKCLISAQNSLLLHSIDLEIKKKLKFDDFFSFSVDFFIQLSYISTAREGLIDRRIPNC